jgi:hypothetical protein
LGLAAYQTAFAVALIMIGVGLICVSLIWWRQAETEPSEPDDAGELREFVDSLPRIDEDAKLGFSELSTGSLWGRSS